MLTGYFLRKLCGNDVSLQLRVDRILSGPYSHPVSLAALENRPLRGGSRELCILFFSHVVAELVKHEPGTDGWRAVISEERAFFEVIMARCRAMRLPVGNIEKTGARLFEIFEEMELISEQLQRVLDRIGSDLISEFFDTQPSEN